MDKIVYVKSNFDYVDAPEQTGTGTGTNTTIYQKKIQKVEVQDEFYMLLRDRETSAYWARNLRTNEEAYSQDNTTYNDESAFWAARTSLIYSTRNITRR